MTMTHFSPAPIARTAIDLPLGRGRVATLVVDEHGISLDDERITFDDTRTVAYGTHRGSLNFVQRRMERHIRIAGLEREIRVALGVHAFGVRHEFVHHQAYGAVTSALHAAVEPRLRAETLRTIATGARVEIGHLQLDSDGISTPMHSTDAPISWAHLPVAEFRDRSVVVTASIDRADEVTWTVPMLTPNAVLLPELLIDAAETFV